MGNSKESSYSFEVLPDYNSISYITKPKENEIGTSCFLSGTKRGHSVSAVPGPGSYNIEYRHKISKNIPANFGSSCQRLINFSTNEVYFII